MAIDVIKAAPYTACMEKSMTVRLKEPKYKQVKKKLIDSPFDSFQQLVEHLLNEWMKQ